MRSLRITLLALLAGVVVANVNAQVHPWEKYGFDPKVITLSKGKYQEFHDLKTVVEIGSILYNTETKEIVGFVEEDTLKENGLKPHIVSRWMCPDPLAEEFSNWSPYNYAVDNPIVFIDLHGLSASPYYDEQGNFLGVDEKGFAGEIFITNKETFEKNSNDKGIANSKTIQADESTKSIGSVGLTPEAESNIYTDVMTKTEGVDFSNLHNGKVSIRTQTVMSGDKIIAKGVNDPQNYPRYGAGVAEDGSYIITVTSGANFGDFKTVEAIQNYLGVHEYYGHRVQGFSGGKSEGGSHWNAYQAQAKHPTFKGLSPEQKQEILSRTLEYLKVENPSLYLKNFGKK